ncbi:MAG: DUF3881 family protein [Lachnospiraceae bacterium]|nr:DUF3881 family protein [Lachnospiraceae bacterium]
MNTFLRSIGFSNLKQQKDIEDIIVKVISGAGGIEKFTRKNGNSFVEYSLATSSSCGIRVTGEEDPEGKFHFNHYFPYVKPLTNNDEEEIYINKKIDTDGYTGMCDDYRLGICLIFYLQNVVYYNNKYGEAKTISDQGVKFGALAESGKILLPTLNYEEEQKKRKKENVKRNKLIAEAKKGNVDAIENLTISEIDNYAKVSMRIKNEDLLSIVDTSITPSGSESEMYNIMGNIISVNSETNNYTGEKLWVMQVESNEIVIDVSINEADLMGVPEPGRRFRGNVWLQGSLTE